MDAVSGLGRHLLRVIDLLPVHDCYHAVVQELLPGYKAAMQAYMDAVSGLGRRLLRVIALALSLPEDFFQAYFDKPLAFLRPLHYSAQVSLPEEVSSPLCAET